MRVALAVAFVVLGWMGVAHAAATPHALRGVALVIGETGYVRLPALVNPDKDAHDIDHMLDDLGFDVTRVLDGPSAALRSKIDEFIANAKGADVALVYYAGHGIEAGGQDYLMGTDADVSNATAAAGSLIAVDDVLGRLKASVPISIMLLDACRTNPFGAQQTITLTDGGPAVAIGEAGLEVVRGPAPVAGGASDAGFGMVVGFSASPGQSALDGAEGENSPYAAALLKHLGAGGYSFGDIMTMVAQEVYVDTGARQLPWTNSSLRRVLYFGRSADANGEDGTILGDRRKLLLDIAAAPTETKAFVEAIATQEALKLSDLYAMLDIINGSKGDLSAAGEGQLLDVAKRVRETLDDPLLTGAPSDPELARLDALAQKALAAGAFKQAFKYRQQEQARAATIEKSLDAQQADIDAKRRELAGVYARIAETAMYNLDSKTEAQAYSRAAKQTDAFDPTLSLKLRLRAADLAFARGDKGDPKARAQATALYEDALKQIDQNTRPALWAQVELKLARAAWSQANTTSDRSLRSKALAAVQAALSYYTPKNDFRQWGEAMRVLAQTQRNMDDLVGARGTMEAVIAQTTRSHSPIDWAFDQLVLGNVYYDAGTEGTDAQMLLLAAAAYTASADAFRPTGFGIYGFALSRAGDASVRAGLRSGDAALVDRGLGLQRSGLAAMQRDLDFSLQSSMLGRDLVLVGTARGDRAMFVEALKRLADAKPMLKASVQKADWAQMREAEGDALAALGAGPPRDAKMLKAAIAAYLDAQEAFDDLGHWPVDRERARQKKIKLQLALGIKPNPHDLEIASLPPPTAFDISNATLNVRVMDDQPVFYDFGLLVGGLTSNGARYGQEMFEMLVDFTSDSKQAGSVNLARIVIEIPNLRDPASRAANYSTCGHLAFQPGQVRLHLGAESANNACVLARMAPGDAAYWEGILAVLPELAHEAAATGDETAGKLDAFLRAKVAVQ